MAPPSMLTGVGDAGVHTLYPLQMETTLTPAGVPLPPSYTVAVARTLHSRAGVPICTPHRGALAGGGVGVKRGRRGNFRKAKPLAVNQQISQASTELATGERGILGTQCDGGDGHHPTLWERGSHARSIHHKLERKIEHSVETHLFQSIACSVILQATPITWRGKYFFIWVTRQQGECLLAA